MLSSFAAADSTCSGSGRTPRSSLVPRQGAKLRGVTRGLQQDWPACPQGRPTGTGGGQRGRGGRRTESNERNNVPSDVRHWRAAPALESPDEVAWVPRKERRLRPKPYCVRPIPHWAIRIPQSSGTTPMGRERSAGSGPGGSGHRRTGRCHLHPREDFILTAKKRPDPLLRRGAPALAVSGALTRPPPRPHAPSRAVDPAPMRPALSRESRPFPTWSLRINVPHCLQHRTLELSNYRTLFVPTRRTLCIPLGGGICLDPQETAGSPITRPDETDHCPGGGGE